MRQVMLMYKEEANGNERGTKTVDIACFGMVDTLYVEKNVYKYG